MTYIIVVDKQSRTSPSADKVEYTINCEELRKMGDVYDELIIENNTAKITRRIGMTELGVTYILATPVEENLGEMVINLFEGDNYIYVKDQSGNILFAEYIVKNEFNDLYATRIDMRSAIEQSAQEISLSVTQTLQAYSTTEEMQGAINLKAGQVMIEVNKKVNDEDLTGANITLRINNDTSEAQINADKIELSANDILNLLSGNTINLTSKNIVISSTYCTLDKYGNLELKDNTSGSTASLYVRKISDSSKYAYIRSDNIYIKNGNSSAQLSSYGENASLNLSANGISSGIGHDNLFISMPSSNADAFSVLQGVTFVRNGKYIDWGPFSLESLKKNISKLNKNAIDLVKTGDIFEFNYNIEEDTDKKHIGFVIGEGYKTPDEVIAKSGDGIDTYSMTSVLWKAVQEQQAMIETLQEKVQRLEEAQNEQN